MGMARADVSVTPRSVFPMYQFARRASLRLQFGQREVKQVEVPPSDARAKIPRMLLAATPEFLSTEGNLLDCDTVDESFADFFLTGALRAVQYNCGPAGC